MVAETTPVTTVPPALTDDDAMQDAVSRRDLLRAGTTLAAGVALSPLLGTRRAEARTPAAAGWYAPADTAQHTRTWDGLASAPPGLGSWLPGRTRGRGACSARDRRARTRRDGDAPASGERRRARAGADVHIVRDR